MSDEKTVIEFGRKELDPAAEAIYREKIAASRAGLTDSLKGQTPVGHVPRPHMPILTPQSGNIAELPSGLNPDGGVSPRPPGSPIIRQETAQQLQAMQAAQTDNVDKKIQEEIKKQEADDALYEAFDTGSRNEAERILNNKKRRKEIEARCTEMSIDDLILKGEVTQTVPILPGKFVAVFRSALPEESLFIKKIIAEEAAVSDEHTLERYGLLQLCCSLVQVNGVKFPDHIDAQGLPDRKMFDEKMKKVMRLSGYIINDLMVNLRWFDIRVRKLMNPEALGNG